MVRAVAVDEQRVADLPPTDPYLIKVTTFHCNDETGTDFLGSDEVYWIFGSVGSGVSVSTRSHIFEDIDSGDSATFDLGEGVIWGHTGVPEPLPDGEIGSLVQLWEHDSSDPDEVKAAVGAAFATAAGILTATGAAAWVGGVVAAVGAVVTWLIGFMDDDHIGDQTFVFTRQTILDQTSKAGQYFELTRPFTDGDGDYSMTLRVTHVAPGAAEAVDRSAQLGTPPGVGSPTACFNPGLGVENIAYRDSSGHLHELWRDGIGGTGTTDLTANGNAPTAVGDPFAYVDTARNTEILLFRGADGTVRSLYWSTGPVGHDNLSDTAGAPKAAGNPVGYYVPGADTNHVIYRGGNGHLHELFWQGLAPVGYGGDLTGSISAPAAAGEPSAFVDGAGFNIVVYRAVDGRILSVYWSDGPSGLDDLSGFAGTPRAAGDPAAYYTAPDDTHQIVYRAGDGHIYELYWAGVAPVAGWDITAASGAPAATGDPAAFYNGGTNTKHVSYRSSDGRLHEIVWTPGGTPMHVDLTALTAAPTASDGPAAFVSPGLYTQHVAYRASNDHIVEVRRS